MIKKAHEQKVANRQTPRLVEPLRYHAMCSIVQLLLLDVWEADGFQYNEALSKPLSNILL